MSLDKKVVTFFKSSYGDMIGLTGWKKLFIGEHIETMRGDFKSNEKHCSKEGQLIDQ